MPIRRLPESLVNQIAAGEVIERPAAALKELVENSLDAGATRIEVDLERGGKELLVVTDDGCGIPKEEISVALERHATSKIAEAADLHRISTLGFRGEALPSIASISKFRLTSRIAGDDVAWEARLEGGKGGALQPVSAPVGTRIEVASLFFNTPVRRKFLKTDATELSHCLDLLSKLALVRPQVGFFVSHNGQRVLEAPATTDAMERVVAILGKKARGELFPLLWEGEAAGDEVRWEGLVGSPNLLGGTTRSIYLFVEGRPIRDRSLAHAVQNAYREVIVERKYPTVILNLRIHPEAVDVNIHPTKTEVRFRAASAVYGTLYKALSTVLEDAPWAPQRPMKPVSYETGEEIAARQHRIEETLGSYQYSRRSSSTFTRGSYVPSSSPRSASFEQAGSAALARADEAPEAAPGFFSSLDIVGQFHNEFLLCQSEGALYLIDQHAAHERIAYERLRGAALGKGGKGAQMLLVPEPVELGASEAAALLETKEDLERIGFELEDYGTSTVLVRAVPAPLAHRPVKALLQDAAAEMIEYGRSRAGDQAIEDLCARMACHSAIRGPTALSEDQARSLLKQMDAIDFAAHCPHGRPVVKEFTRAEIEHLFKRAL